MSDNDKIDIDDDYQYSRQLYRSLLNHAESIIPAAVDLAKESESPRAFETLAGLLKNTSEIADKLMDLQQKKKNVTAPIKNTMPALEGGSTITNNNVFVGDTTSLQKMLLKQQNVIDVDETRNH